MKAALRLALLTALPLLGSGAAALTAPSAGEGGEFFEKQIRPLLLTRCGECHDAAHARGGLSLADRRSLLRGGGRGPAIVPLRPERSLLLAAVERRGDLKMPPAGPLPEREIALLRRWISLGAPWPEPRAGAPPAPGALRVTAAQRRWWAFRPLRDVPPPLPALRTRLSPIDRFLRAAMAPRGLTPAPPAGRRTWIRRATFDLTGLPPTPEEVDAFLRDTAPGAWERVVDRLLASPDYGVRYARHWLDVARYADYHDGDPKARTASCEPLHAWRYRDWVVDSLNRDLPFDRFIVHQLAGDLLPSPDGRELYADGLVATTFLTNGSWDRGDADKEKMVSDMVDDQIDTTGKAFLGLTLGCARCHDHKFDPISQRDYYALAGIFYSTHILKDLGAKGGEYTLNRVPLAPKEYVARREQQLARLEAVKGRLAELERGARNSAPEDPERLRLEQERDRLQSELLPEPPVAEAAQEGGTAGGLFPGIQDVPIHIRGSYTRLGEVVPRRMPLFFAGGAPSPIRGGSGRRELAAWIASKANPLTARVIVNRVWQWHFGAGLVRTPNNFGMLSEPPSHPELLDWLASRFLEDGWSLKKLHRRIMLSAAYRQASTVPREQAARDPENRWLSRFSPRRLEAEAIRDAVLAAAGRLDPARGGPAVADMNVPRRSLYVQTARWDRGSFAILFDAANPDASVEQRFASTVTPQALFLLNHEFMHAQARHLAGRLSREVPSDDTARLERAFELLFARPPTPEELRIQRDFLRRSGARGSDAAWTDLAHVLLCSNEFVFLD